MSDALNVGPASIPSGVSREYEPARSAYIHIPFCRRRCFYCDFPISVLGDRLRGEASGTIEAYLQQLEAEILATPVLGDCLDTVFLGGGTPSLLSPCQLERLLSLLDRRFGLAAGAEISIEMDPGTFDGAQLQAYRLAGITRVSLGVQAFDDAALEACGRTHRVADVHQAIALMHQVQMPSWSLDLISGLPHQHLTSWAAGLEQAIAAQPSHLSIYDLTIEPQTVFARRYHPGVAPLPTDEQTADMYRLAQHVLTTHGYEHYEISNYARPGHRCRHNLTYWQNAPYYGFGMGATSYTAGQRFGRPRTRRAYAQWVELFRQRGGTLTIPAVTPGEQFLDQLLLGLRLAAGVPGSVLAALADASLKERLFQCLAPFIDQGWVCLGPAVSSSHLQTYPTIRLSDPEGFLFSNQILIALFSEFSDLYSGDEPGASIE